MSKTSYVCKMTEEQAKLLQNHLEVQGWELDIIPYTWFRAKKDKTTVAAYTSGKVTVQGRGTAELVQFIIEPEILKEARFGYEEVLVREENADMFQPHAGIDESGKGDFFGPLVIACAYVDERSADKLLEIGVTDSKKIKSAKKINELAAQIRKLTNYRFAIVRIGPAAYNQMYARNRNLNRMLAWGHARALEDLLAKVPDCPRAVSDQFASKSTVKRALMEKGQKIELEERTKAEADIAVAAASILARQVFVEQLNALSQAANLTLPLGASSHVLAAAVQFIRQHGEAALSDYAKTHFVTATRAAAIANGFPDPVNSADPGS